MRELCEKCGGLAFYNSHFGGYVCTKCGHIRRKKLTWLKAEAEA